jgi:N-acetylglutamate synthase
MTETDQEPVNAMALAREIEPHSIASWPARETTELHGWLLRFTNGFTHRGNSVATLHFDATEISAVIANVEDEYQRRALPPMFQIASAVAPSMLARELLSRGYEVITPTHVLVGSPGVINDRLSDVPAAQVAYRPSPDFISLVLEGSRSAEDGRERIEILSRIVSDRICVTAEVGGASVACGTGTLTDGYVGINMMRTTPSCRRQGHARRVLSAIAGWAAENRVKRLYLSVEMQNAPAIALYRSAGFEPGYTYRYYRKPLPGS